MIFIDYTGLIFRASYIVWIQVVRLDEMRPSSQFFFTGIITFAYKIMTPFTTSGFFEYTSIGAPITVYPLSSIHFDNLE